MSDGLYWQYIDSEGNDIGGSMYAEEDAKEVRAWDGEHLLMEVIRTRKDNWAIVQPVRSNRLAKRRFEAPRLALEALNVAQDTVPAGTIRVERGDKGLFRAMVPVEQGDDYTDAGVIRLSRRAAVRAINRARKAAGLHKRRTYVTPIGEAMGYLGWAEWTPTHVVGSKPFMEVNRHGWGEQVTLILRNRKGEEFAYPEDRTTPLGG